MDLIKSLNLLIAFLLELCLLAIFGYWGISSSSQLWQKIIFGIGLPLIVAVVWGIFLAPASSTRLTEPWLNIAKIVIFSLAALVLFSTGKPSLAAAFEVIFLINLVLLFIWKQ